LVSTNLKPELLATEVPLYFLSSAKSPSSSSSPKKKEKEKEKEKKWRGSRRSYRGF